MKLKDVMFIADHVSELQKLRRKLGEALRLLARHVAAHPEIEFSQEHIRLFSACQDLERQLDRLERGTKDTG
jgi:hypothetical protein